MTFCHGNGELARDGCCYLQGQVCPLRWKIESGRILEGPSLTDLGTVADYAASLSNNPNIQQRIIDQTAGVTFLCRAAVEVLVDDTKLLNDRPGFEAAWLAHPDYVAQVAPVWRQVEQNAGLPVGALDCPTWRGGVSDKCCFGEDTATNESKAAGLATDADTVRRAGGTA